MHAGRHYSLGTVLHWTRREIAFFTLIAAVPVALNEFVIRLPPVPWQPIAMLGTAVAFMTGFKSNAAYGRLWEARQIWGGIVNASRAWALGVRDFVGDPSAPEVVEAHRRLVYRQLGWLTALRFQLREPRLWETQRDRHNMEFREGHYVIPERHAELSTELEAFLDAADRKLVLGKKNRATAILSLQSADLRAAAERGWLGDYKHVELSRAVSNLIDLQGRCERIKNFPYPRQFSTLNLIFVWLFIGLLPLGMVAELAKTGTAWTWVALPLTVVVAWVLHTMDKIGDASENPFEGGPNDVPITTMSRAIEIDLKDLAGESDLPKPILPVGEISM